MADVRLFFHDELVWKNPGQANSTGRMNGVAELFLEHSAPNAPWKQRGEKQEKASHRFAPR